MRFLESCPRRRTAVIAVSPRPPVPGCAAGFPPPEVLAEADPHDALHETRAATPLAMARLPTLEVYLAAAPSSMASS